MKVLVLGGCGYVGSRLVPHLLADGHRVRVFDIQWFGDGYLPTDNGRCELIKGDIRDARAVAAACKGMDAVINLACVSNDHSCQLDERLSTEINYDAFEPMVLAAKRAGVRRFIYASSSSVYGVSDAPVVTEEHPLVPLTLYNRYKGLCEPLLLAQKSADFECVILRPATVCGYAPRQRFDLTVNILTAHAVLKGVITVFGGEQKRPNLHIRDMIDCYRTVLTAPAEKVNGETFNVGRQNMRVREIATLVKDVVAREMGISCEIETTQSTDTRSYHVNSDKIRRVLGFEATRSVEDAIRELCIKFREGRFRDALTNPWYTNIRQMIEAGVSVTDSLASYRADRYPAALS